MIICYHLIPWISLLDHVYETKQFLDSNTSLATCQLLGQLGEILLGEGVALLEDAHEVTASGEIGNMENISEG